MFDRVRDASKRALSENADEAPDEEVVSGLATLLDDDESTEHALWSTGTLERTIADRTETMAPRSDGFAFALVSDRRILFVVDDGDRSTPDSEISLAEVTAVEHKDSLLRSSFSVETSDERVSFVPEGGDVESVVTYLDRTAQRWRDLHAELENAQELMSAYRDEDGMYTDIWRVAKQIRSHVNAADDVVGRYDDAVADRLATALAPVAADLAVDLRTEAESVVDTVDVDDDGAETAYEQIRDVLEHAHAIAVGPAQLDAAPFDASLERLAETIERSQWQWGGT